MPHSRENDHNDRFFWIGRNSGEHLRVSRRELEKVIPRKKREIESVRLKDLLPTVEGDSAGLVDKNASHIAWVLNMLLRTSLGQAHRDGLKIYMKEPIVDTWRYIPEGADLHFLTSHTQLRLSQNSKNIWRTKPIKSLHRKQKTTTQSVIEKDRNKMEPLYTSRDGYFAAYNVATTYSNNQRENKVVSVDMLLKMLPLPAEKVEETYSNWQTTSWNVIHRVNLDQKELERQVSYVKIRNAGEASWKTFTGEDIPHIIEHVWAMGWISSLLEGPLRSLLYAKHSHGFSTQNIFIPPERVMIDWNHPKKHIEVARPNC